MLCIISETEEVAGTLGIVELVQGLATVGQPANLWFITILQFFLSLIQKPIVLFW